MYRKSHGGQKMLVRLCYLNKWDGISYTGPLAFRDPYLSAFSVAVIFKSTIMLNLQNESILFQGTISEFIVAKWHHMMK